MPKIELNAYDLIIKEMDSGDEVVQIRGNLAFNTSFIDEMKQAGVEKFVPKEE